MSTDTTPLPSPARSPARVAGVFLILASVLSVAILAFHPHVHGNGDFAQALADVALVNAVVHGSLVGLFAVLVYAYSVFADCLGSDRPAVRLGLIAFAVSALPIMVAGITSGFVVPEYGARYVGKSAADQEVMHHVVRLGLTVVRVGSRVGVAGTSVALVLWAVAVLRGRPVLGTVGLLAGGLPLAALAAGHLPMDTHGMMAYALAQATWGLFAGVVMVRGDARTS